MYYSSLVHSLISSLVCMVVNYFANELCTNEQVN